MTSPKQPRRIAVGGPVGVGKTALVEQRCKRLGDALEVAAITNDIYTKEDARILVEAGALAPDRIMGVEIGGRPHTAIREDASINLAAVSDMRRRFADLDCSLIESGGDNLTPGGRHHARVAPAALYAAGVCVNRIGTYTNQPNH